MASNPAPATTTIVHIFPHNTKVFVGTVTFATASWRSKNPADFVIDVIRKNPSRITWVRT